MMFLGYIHSFRALAILFIVAGHTIDFFQWSESDEDIEKLLRIFVSNGSVLFVFIAGYLFQHLSIKYDTKKYLITKLKNVIVPYILVSIPAIFVFVIMLHRDTVWQGFYDNPQWLQVIYFYLTGMHLAPLWFIPMITLFYVVAPMLMKGDKGKLFYWGLPIAILLSCFVSRGLPHQSFIHFFSVYMMGMFCSHYKHIINDYLKKANVLIMLFSILMLCGLMEFYYMQSTMTYLNYLQKMAMSLFFLGAFINLGHKLDSRFIHKIADTSFGVFFIHSYFLTAGKLSFVQFFGDKLDGSLLLFPIVTVSVLLVCVFVIVVIQKMFGSKSRYLVGS